MSSKKETYTIISINQDAEGNPAPGHACIKFDIDGKTQCLSNLPLNDEEALKAGISEYLVNYAAGLEVANTAEVETSKAVENLVGKSQTIEG